MYLISGNITSNVTGNLLVITGNGNIGNITSNFRTLIGTVFVTVMAHGRVVQSMGRYKPCTGRTSHIVNHAPAPCSQKWLTDTMLNENPLFLCSNH